LQVALDVDHVSLGSSDFYIVAPKTLFDRSMALVPLARRRILAEDDEADGYEDDENTRNHK
jgi:hypothetical protein